MWPFTKHPQAGILFAVKLDDLPRYMRAHGLADGELGTLKRKGDIYILFGPHRRNDETT